MEILVFFKLKSVKESIVKVYRGLGYIPTTNVDCEEDVWVYEDLENLIIGGDNTAFVLSEFLVWIPEKRCYALWDPDSEEAKEIPPEESEWGFLLPPLKTVKDWIEVINGRRVHTQLPSYDDKDNWGPVCSNCLYVNHPVKPCEVCGKMKSSSASNELKIVLMPDRLKTA